MIIDPMSNDERWAAVGDGYRADARIVVDERRDALIVPVSALLHVRKRNVKIAARGSQKAAIDSGLAENDLVVVYPSSSLSDGSRVQVDSN